METYTLAPVAELRALLTAAGIRNAEDPGRLTPPGVLVQVTGFTRTVMGGPPAVTTRLYVVAPDADHHRALEELLELLNRLTAAGIDPDGDVTAATLTLPGDATGLPALMFPLNLTA